MANSRISALPAASTPLAGTELVPIVQGGITERVSVANLTAGRTVDALSLSVTQGITGGSGFQVSGFTSYRSSGASASSPGDASMYFNSATGQTFQARAGSSYDWSLINPGNANYIARVPTGTLNLELAGGNLAFSTSGKGIDFSATSGSGTSELLADYEEGTWTPVVTPAVGAITSYTITTATYTKVGRFVMATTRFTITNAGTGVGGLDITLPFAAGTQNSTGTAFESALTGDAGRAWVASGASSMLVAKYNNVTYCVTNAVITATAIYSV